VVDVNLTVNKLKPGLLRIVQVMFHLQKKLIVVIPVDGLIAVIVNLTVNKLKPGLLRIVQMVLSLRKK